VDGGQSDASDSSSPIRSRPARIVLPPPTAVCNEPVKASDECNREVTGTRGGRDACLGGTPGSNR
jgi:hypothetical protein